VAADDDVVGILSAVADGSLTVEEAAEMLAAERDR
jgi:hypothetical protein